jgi:hypothetical protein
VPALHRPVQWRPLLLRPRVRVGVVLEEHPRGVQVSALRRSMQRRPLVPVRAGARPRRGRAAIGRPLVAVSDARWSGVHLVLVLGAGLRAVLKEHPSDV